MRTTKFLAVFILFLGLAAPAALAAQQATPESAKDVVAHFYDQLLSTMKQGEQLGYEGRYQKLEPAVTETFNLPLMARFAAGPAWREATPEEQQKLAEVFARFSVANYASQFRKFDGEKFEVLGEKPASGGGTIVETKLTPRGDAPVALNYLLRTDDKGQLRIVDVYLDGSISELATRRSEFTSVIKHSGWTALLSSLDEKIKKMGG